MLSVMQPHVSAQRLGGHGVPQNSWFCVLQISVLNPAVQEGGLEAVQQTCANVVSWQTGLPIPNAREQSNMVQTKEKNPEKSADVYLERFSRFEREASQPKW